MIYFERARRKKQGLKRTLPERSTLARPATMPDQLPSKPPKAEPGVVASSVYAKGKRIADISVDEAGTWQKKAGHVVWIGLFEPGHELLSRVQRQLNLHPLAIEDAEQAHQHPK